VQWRTIVAILSVDARFEFEQQLDHVRVAFVRRSVEASRRIFENSQTKILKIEASMTKIFL
jgi:hypothetical protein